MSGFPLILTKTESWHISNQHSFWFIDDQANLDLCLSNCHMCLKQGTWMWSVEQVSRSRRSSTGVAYHLPTVILSVSSASCLPLSKSSLWPSSVQLSSPGSEWPGRGGMLHRSMSLLFSVSEGGRRGPVSLPPRRHLTTDRQVQVKVARVVPVSLRTHTFYAHTCFGTHAQAPARLWLCGKKGKGQLQPCWGSLWGKAGASWPKVTWRGHMMSSRGLPNI